LASARRCSSILTVVRTASTWRIMMRNELFAEWERGGRRRFEMSPLLMVCLSLGVPLAGVGLSKLQARLERWDYQRHVQD
jgi:hypothetical protein